MTQIMHLARALKLRLVAAFVTAIAAVGCGTTDAAGPAKSTKGSIALAVLGLPSGATASIVVNGPNSYSRTLTESSVLDNLEPGTYTISAGESNAGVDIYSASVNPPTAPVTQGIALPVFVTYSLATGSLAVSLTGLPDGTTPSVTITGPGGFSRTISTSGVLSGLRAGTYTAMPAAVSANGHTYASAERTIQVQASPSPSALALAFDLASGAVTGLANGLPQTQTPTLILTGPNGVQQSFTPGQTLSNLVPGVYTLTGAPVIVGPDIYAVVAPSSITITASTTPIAGTVQYVLTTGRLAITIQGLPNGLAPNVVVSGPNGFQRTVDATGTITGLAPGSYSIAAGNVTSGSVTYQPTPTIQQVSVEASTLPAAASVNYGITNGGLTVIINGLSQSVPAAVTVTGPGGYTRQVTTTTQLANLTPGAYTVAAANTLAGLHVYAPSITSQVVNVAASATPASATVVYSLNSGMLQLTVLGLPVGVSASIQVNGPGGFTQAVTGSQLLVGLLPGSYTISASPATSGAQSWAPSPASQSISIAPSIVATQATVSYSTAMGSLTVNVGGLPGGVAGSVTVTGPGGYGQVVASTTTLTGLLAGLYTATASPVTNGADTYAVTPASQSVVVGGGATSSVTMSYVLSGGPPPPPPPPPAGLNLTIDGMHVQQVVQTYAGTVPLVANRGGLLRVFVKASAANSATPSVRVRFYDGATLVSTITITAPGASVPTTVREDLLTSSWNYTMPSSLLKPGLRILADVDPTDAVAESAESDNAFPSSGTPLSMDVRSVSALNVRFVPITQSANGLTGTVNNSLTDDFLFTTAQVYPLQVVNSDVRAAFTTAAPALDANDNNGAWNQILSELNALRTADASASYYVGVVKVTYGSGIAGLGYVPGRASLSWDYLPSGDDVVAHELGHNFGRFHAPCGGAGGPDPSYPYAGGNIGVYGYDANLNVLKAPTAKDLMGYCNNNWISDYNYTAVLNYRNSNPFVAAAARAAAPRRGLLVWGRVVRGQLILEPAFEVDAPPSLPTRAGAHRVQAFGPNGETLFDLSFDGERIADVPDATARHFAFVVPYDMFRGTEPSRLRLSAGSRVVERAGGRAAALTPTLERLNGRQIRVSWGDTLSGVLVRSARTGDILAFARGGQAVVNTTEDELDLTNSDGVRNARQRVRVTPRSR